MSIEEDRTSIGDEPETFIFLEHLNCLKSIQFFWVVETLIMSVPACEPAGESMRNNTGGILAS